MRYQKLALRQRPFDIGNQVVREQVKWMKLELRASAIDSLSRANWVSSLSQKTYSTRPDGSFARIFRASWPDEPRSSTMRAGRPGIAFSKKRPITCATFENRADEIGEPATAISSTSSNEPVSASSKGRYHPAILSAGFACSPPETLSVEMLRGTARIASASKLRVFQPRLVDEAIRPP